jgi:hypothetical protein
MADFDVMIDAILRIGRKVVAENEPNEGAVHRGR